jgi:hypothetical protein
MLWAVAPKDRKRAPLASGGSRDSFQRRVSNRALNLRAGLGGETLRLHLHQDRGAVKEVFDSESLPASSLHGRRTGERQRIVSRRSVAMWQAGGLNQHGGATHGYLA